MVGNFIGVDAGNKNIKLYGEKGEMLLPSAIGEYRERKLEQRFSKNDLIFEFNGRKGFAGTLAQFESQFMATRMGDSKAHEEMLIRTLIGLHRYSDDTDFIIVVGQPISKHTKSEKTKMKNMLEGVHSITVNEEPKQIVIHRAEIAAEGGAAFWANPRKGKVRILEIGSGTVNGATLVDGKYIDKDSFTIKDGMDTLLTEDVYGLVRKVCLHALKYWNVDDVVLLAGGGATTFMTYVNDFFENVSVMNIQVCTQSGEVKQLPPIFANAVGFYNIARKVLK